MYLIDKNKILDSAALTRYIQNFYTNTQPKLTKWKNYYDGKHIILQKTYSDASKPCAKIVTNFCKTIVDTYAGYICGKPISYVSDNDIENIQKVLNYNDPHTADMQFLVNALSMGIAYELQYLDEEANIRYAQIDPLNAFAIYGNDLDRELKYFVRWYSVDELDQTNKYVVEVYDSQNITTYQMAGVGGQLIQTAQDRHYFNDVPVSVFELNENDESIFSQIITLNDAYNELQSSEIDDFSAWVDAYLLLTNVDAENEDIATMKENRVLVLPEGGSAQWLTKNSNDTQIENMLNNIKKNIYKISAAPDMADENFLAQSGTALQFKLVGFENTASGIVANMTKALQRRIELICNILQLKASDAVWRDVQIQFTRNIPNNNLEMAQVVNQLRGAVSDKTLLSLLPFVSDPDKELEALNEQKQSNIDLYSFGNQKTDNSETDNSGDE